MAWRFQSCLANTSISFLVCLPKRRCLFLWTISSVKRSWLKTLRFLTLNADVDLLIGTNASKLMEPWKVINSHGDEIAALTSSSPEVPRSSSIYKLDPILDEGLLRVGGWLSEVAIPEDIKHPLIISKDQHISNLILRHVHLQLGHGGRNHVLSTVRRKYWITSGISAVRKIIRRCLFCKRYRGKTGDQKMADLSEERVVPDLLPFTNVGVDYFGPVDVKRKCNTVKWYGVVFTCMTSRPCTWKWPTL